MIGDTTHDLELARNAGVAAVAVAYGAHGREGLAAAAPLATVHSVRELRRLAGASTDDAASGRGGRPRGPGACDDTSFAPLTAARPLPPP